MTKPEDQTAADQRIEDLEASVRRLKWQVLGLAFGVFALGMAIVDLVA